MRGSLMLSLGLSALLIAEVAVVAPTRADPAYTADQLVKIFRKDKATVDATKKMGGTRGITWKDDDATVAATDPSAAGPTRVDLLVNFEIDSANLTSQAKENLSQFATAVKDPSLKGTKFKIEGYTDATGPESYNLTLSERRARSVVAFLATLGVDARSLQAKGFGKSNPRDADPFSPKNRRVEGYLAE